MAAGWSDSLVGPDALATVPVLVSPTARQLIVMPTPAGFGTPRPNEAERVDLTSGSPLPGPRLPGHMPEVTGEAAAPIGRFPCRLTGLLAAWTETVYHVRPHEETRQPQVRRRQDGPPTASEIPTIGPAARSRVGGSPSSARASELPKLDDWPSGPGHAQRQRAMTFKRVHTVSIGYQGLTSATKVHTV